MFRVAMGTTQINPPTVDTRNIQLTPGPKAAGGDD